MSAALLRLWRTGAGFPSLCRFLLYFQTSVSPVVSANTYIYTGEGRRRKKKGGGVGGKVVAPQKMMLSSLMRTAAGRPPSRLHRSAPSRLAVYADTHFFPNQPLGSFRRVRYGSGLLRGNLAGIHLTPVVTWWNDTFNHWASALCFCDRPWSCEEEVGRSPMVAAACLAAQIESRQPR